MDWLDIVVSNQAKNKIKQYFKNPKRMKTRNLVGNS